MMSHIRTLLRRESRSDIWSFLQDKFIFPECPEKFKVLKCILIYLGTQERSRPRWTSKNIRRIWHRKFGQFRVATKTITTGLKQQEIIKRSGQLIMHQYNKRFSDTSLQRFQLKTFKWMPDQDYGNEPPWPLSPSVVYPSLAVQHLRKGIWFWLSYISFSRKQMTNKNLFSIGVQETQQTC